MITTSAGERTVLHLDKLPRKVMNNKVLLRVEDNLDDGCEYETEGGLKLILAGGEFEESSRVVRFGTVVRVPDKLVTKSKSHPKGMEWECDMELEEGDRVLIGVMAGANADMLIIDDLSYFLVNYEEIILRRRNGVVTPINGFCVVEKFVEDKIEADGLVLDFQKDVHDKRRGRVRFNGANNKRYFIGSNIDAKVEVGDDVVFSIEAWTPLEDELFAEMDANLGYIQKSWISGKF